ncbi:MAG: acyltransferase family protein, partial [Candidatus Bathyarchaeota archaeon]|nr:acyltransferase family protein [Candidatus Bathyarchaeota archaeon]
MQNTTASKTRIVEFDLLKIIALLLIVFVHSDLILVFPDVINPVKWFLVSCFFFVSGFLALNSFYARGAGVLSFIKTKIVLLYIPFAVASVFYFVLQIIL